MKNLEKIYKIGTLMVDNEDLESLLNWNDAKKMIELLNSQDYKGFNDWRLPTKIELNEMYLKKDFIGGFSSNFYWSSSEYNANYAWIQYFSSGFQYNSSKYNLELVRCVRSV